MMNVVEQKSLVSPQQTSFNENLRNAIRARIYAMLQKKIPQKTDASSQQKLLSFTNSIEKKLMSFAKSEKEYSNLRDLENRVEHLLRELCKRYSSQRRACPPTSVGMISVSHALDTSMATFSSANNLPNATLQSGSIPPINCTNGGGSLFNGCQRVSAGFPISSGDSGFNKTTNIDQSLYSDGAKVSAIGSDLHRHQTSGANVQMVDVCRPNVHQITSGICSPLTTTGFGISRNNSVPLATRPMTSEELLSSTYLPTLSKPLVQPVDQLQAASNMHRYSMNNADSFGSSNLYGVVTSSGSMAVLAQNPNPMLRVDATFTSNQSNLQGMQQNPLPLHQLGNKGFQSACTNKENLAQVSRQLLDRGFHPQTHDMEHQGQRSQQLYPGQLQKQERLLYEDAYRTQLARGLATPVKHGPSLDVYKEALQKQAINGFRPSKFQYQQNAVKDQYIGAQSASVHNSQLNSSPSFRPHPHQKQSASVLVQTQSSLQKPHPLPHQKQPVSVLVQTQSSLQKPHPHQKQSASVLVQTQSSLQKPHPHQKQSASVLVQTQSSLQKPHPHQKQSASVLVQTQSSLQNPTQITENNNGEREQIGVNLCQRTPMQPEAVNRCSSARPPISHQTVSPTSTAERKRLPDGNNTSSKLVKGDGGRIDINCMRWILFMSHARYCSAPEGKCESEYCFRAKKILKHSQHCKVPDCTYLYCPETRELMHHYKKCRDKSCRVCVFVKYFKKKHIEASLREAKCSSASLKGRPREFSESRQAYNKGGTEAPSVDDDLQPSTKRLKIEQPSQNATSETESNSVSVCGVVYKSHSSMDIQGKDGLLSDDCKSVKVEVMPMDIDVSDASGIPVTREVEKHVVEDTPKGKNGGEFAMDDKTVCLSAQGKSQCMNEMSASKEENVKQSVDAVDASKMEISSLVELFTPEQVREHIRGLRQWIGQSKTKADKNKAMGYSMSVNSCQLCAVERLVFEPIPIYCSPCGVRIKRNASHYSVVASESPHYVCAPCYNDARENSVSVDGTSIPKARLEKKKNDEQVGEAWVQCDKCQAWQHQICALFNSRRNHGEATKYTCPNCYIQEVEQGERIPLPQSAIPGAKSLPVTTLSNHIEQRLFKNLKNERQERARFQGKSYEEVPGAESLAVRVVASVDKVLEVKECFRELFREENYPSEFPYKSKAILLFQKIESVEVCLFGMFVQEFGTKSGPPNQRRVYISYLDSVKYFRPEVRTVSGEALRTFVYHEILIGYLDYCKKRGFTSCYIWACPPLKGEDYILYCHPEIQKTPKADKLRDWYLAMLRKALKEDVVVECTNLYDQFFVQSGECRANVTAARLPYFDGDYWPGAAADLIQQMSQEDDGTKLNRKGFTKKVISKRALKAVGQLDLSVNALKDRLTMQKLGEIICPLKEDFIMVHLQHCCKHCCTLMVSGNRWVCNQCKNFQICGKCNEAEQKHGEKERHPVNQKEKHTLFPVAIKDIPIEIEDKDDNIESEFFDNRQAFLSLCQGNNYQYDTLRRAKHSSMMLLYHLHNPTAPAFATTCIICQQEVENGQGWRCEVCPGYDVCNACYPKASIDHSHNLISRSSATDTVVQQNGRVNQNDQIQLEKVKQFLVHVTACRSPQCQYQGCHKMKILFKHCIDCNCKIGPAGCPLCKRFWGVIELHARFCRDSQCTVPKCRDLRAISIRKQQQSDKRRRAAVMEMMRERAAEATRTS